MYQKHDQDCSAPQGRKAPKDVASNLEEAQSSWASRVVPGSDVAVTKAAALSVKQPKGAREVSAAHGVEGRLTCPRQNLKDPKSILVLTHSQCDHLLRPSQWLRSVTSVGKEIRRDSILIALSPSSRPRGCVLPLLMSTMLLQHLEYPSTVSPTSTPKLSHLRSWEHAPG